MALFWSKKSKAEKIRDTSVVGSKTVPAKATRSVKATKVLSPIAKKEKPQAKTTAVAVPSISNASSFTMAGVILRPRITEKSGALSQMGVYTFEVTRDANKNSVSSAIKSLYKVIPVKVAILNNPAKKVFVRGRRGVVPGVRKALVTLKKGEKMDFV